MKTIIAFLILTLPAISLAGELNLQPYAEYTNDLNYTNNHFNGDVHHFRLGVEAGRFYGEFGQTNSYDGSGLGGEIGYEFEIGKKLTVGGSWEGIRLDSNLEHTLETELRWRF